MLFVVAYDLYELRDWRESTLTPSSLWPECFRWRRWDDRPFPPPFFERWLRCDRWLFPPRELRERPDLFDRPPSDSRSAAVERGPRAFVTSSKSHASFGVAWPDASMSMTRPSLFIRFSRRIRSFASRISAAAASEDD